MARYKSIPKSDSVYDISLARAVELLAAPKTARGAAGKELGSHPDDQKPVTLMSAVATAPTSSTDASTRPCRRDYDPEALTLEESARDPRGEVSQISSRRTTPRGRGQTLEPRKGRRQPEATLRLHPRSAVLARPVKKKAPARAPAKRTRG